MTFNKVKEIIIDTLNLDADAITLDADLLKDLDADSLDAVELIMALEEAYGIEIPEEASKSLTKIGDIVKYIDEHANGAA